MRPRLTLGVLVVLALLALSLWWIGDTLEQSTRGEPYDPGAWLAEHGDEAERIARQLLADGTLPPLSMTLASTDPRRVEAVVVFRLRRGGLKGLDRGVAFAPDGKPPPLGLGGDPPVRWERIHGAWWGWEAP